MNLRALWSSVRAWYAAHSVRDQRIILGVAAAVLASVLYVGIVDPLVRHRRHVAEEISEGQEELERAARFIGAMDTLRAERDELRQRFEQAKGHLIAADSGTLGAAALQERANALAGEKGVTIQSTQVMREEAADPFRKVSVRLTLTGELKPFADFVAGLEYGAQELRVPYAELSRRGAVAGAKGPRTLSATIEVSGYLLAAAPAKAKPAEGEAGEGEGAGNADTEAGSDAGEGAPGRGPADANAPGPGTG